ncbi:MASE1 domain-containing protein [bacterium]|nr:MASE1 domain-containing protein [bacterium]
MSASSLNLIVATAYFATGWLGLQIPYYGQHVTLVWAPTAVALAAVIVAGPLVIPGIVLGSFGLNATLEPGHLGPAALIAIGNTLAPALTGTALVRWFGFRPQLDRLRDAFLYLAVGVVGTGLITATLGASWLCAFGDAPWGDYATVWMSWFGGEAAGSLIVGPLLLTWLSAPDPIVANPAPPVEKTAMALSVVIVSALVLAFGERLVSLPYAFAFLFPWILARAGLRGVFLAVAAVALVLVVATALGIGPFIVQSPRSGMLSLWLFLAVVGSVSLTGGGLIGERDHALHHQRRLLAELDHRVKNTLATIIALTERSGDRAIDLEDFRAGVIGRIRAIARTHESLARSNWQPMRVDDIVAMTLAPFASVGSDHLLASGDPATLAPSQVGPLTVVLHELATNAAKYGAWSRQGGRVSVAWARSATATLRISWRESGGPPPAASPLPGYGLRLIEGTVGHELAGDAELDFSAEGLVCTLHIPTA